MTDLFSRIQGWQCPIGDPINPFIKLLRKPRFDEEGYQRAERINGIVECPNCGLDWPLIEEIEAWTEGDDGRWYGCEWGPGFTECLECGLLIVSTFDGDFVFDPSSTSESG